MNRLALLFSLALVTGFATALADAQQRTAGFPSGTIVDLSYAFDSSTVYWPTAETFHLEKDFGGPTDKGYYNSAYRYSAAEHGGTHIDENRRIKAIGLDTASIDYGQSMLFESHRTLFARNIPALDQRILGHRTAHEN